MEMVSFTLRLFYLRGKSFGAHQMGGWVRFRAGLDAVVEREITAALGNRTPVVQLIT
jgi:hypothetical protein